MITDELQRIIAGVSETALLLWQKGWAERNGGNISVNVTTAFGDSAPSLRAERGKGGEVPDLAGAAILITGAGTRMREVAQDPEANCCILRVDPDGYHIVWGGRRPGFRPTSELASHLAIHADLIRRKAPQRAFLHTHPNELIALTLLPVYNSEEAINRLLWAMHPEVKIVLPEGVGWAPYLLPGSDDLAAATISALQHHRAALWVKHGCVAVGADAAEAFDLIDTLNKAAQLFFLSRSAGVSPAGLTAEQVEELARLSAGEPQV